MKWLDRIIKKRKNPQAIYTILFHANNKNFVDSLTKEQREWLINDIKCHKPEKCICCPCFAWEFGEDKAISGCICTLGGDVSENGKGQCHFE